MRQAHSETGSLSTVDLKLSRKTTTTTTKKKKNYKEKNKTVCFKPSLPPGECVVLTCSYYFCCHEYQK